MNKLVTLKISNRGSSVREGSTNQSWTVSLPAQLTMGSRPCVVQVVSGTIQHYRDDTVFHTYSELKVRSNISMNGFSTETASDSGFDVLSDLFSVDLAEYGTNDTLQTFSLDNPRTFYCAALPSEVQFSRWVTGSAGPIPLAENAYISFVLEITFTDPL